MNELIYVTVNGKDYPIERRIPVIRYWLPGETESDVTAKLRDFVNKTFFLNGKEKRFYVKIGFPFGVEFHFLPTLNDWKRLVSPLVDWFFSL